MKRSWNGYESVVHDRQVKQKTFHFYECVMSRHDPLCSAQYAALIELTQCLRAHYPIEHIAGHSDIASGRKTDPGPCFDWRRYAINVNRGDLFRAVGHAAIDHEKP